MRKYSFKFPISNFQFLISLLLSIGIFLLFPSPSKATTEFISTIDPDNAVGTDYTSLAAWEAAVQSDLAATTTQVFSGTRTGGIADNTAVYLCRSGVYQTGNTATLVHAASSSQILLRSIAGGTAKQANDVWYTNTTCNSASYFTLSGAQAAGDSAIAVATCRSTGGTDDTTAVEILGWTTATTTYIKIWTDPTDTYGRHKGKWDDAKYVLSTSDASASVNISEDHVRVYGLQVKRTISGNYRYGIVVNGTLTAGQNEIYLGDNIVQAVNSSAYNSGIGLGVAGDNRYARIYITNNIVFNFDNNIGIRIRGDSTGYIYNNTVFSARECFYNQTTLTVYAFNNIAQDCEIYGFRGTYGASGNNISNLNDAEGDDSKSLTSVSFLDAANYDFHLASDDTAAINAGTSTVFWDASAPVQYDIDYTARGAAFDIGADEVGQEFVSTICETNSAGGDCANRDYSRLFDWENLVESNLSASTTRVFSGWKTGTLNENYSLDVYVGGSDTGINVVVVATTTDQILVDGITGTSSPLIAASGTQFRYTGGTTNMWTVTGTGDSLGASPIAVAMIDGEWSASDTQAVSITGWTTDNDNYIRIYTADAARHNGVFSDSKYRLVSIDEPLNIVEDYAKVQGLQLVSTANGTWDAITNFDSYNDLGEFEYSSNLAVGYTNTQLGSGGVKFTNCRLVKAFNNIIYTTGFWLYGGIFFNCDLGTGYFYNNTIYNFGRGIEQDNGTVIAINNIIASSTDPFNGAFAAATTHNATDISDTPTGGANTLVNQVFSFVSTTANAEDFHLAESDAGARNAGFDYSSSSTLDVISSFSTDIDGALRNPDDLGWDIGADETAAKQYRSVGNDTASLGSTGTVTISSSTRTATFSAAQADNVGVGDVIQFGGAGYYDLAFITGRSSSTVYSVQAWDTRAPTATTSAAFNIYRAHLTLNDWETQTVENVNSGISDTVDDWVVLASDDLVASNTVQMIAAYASSNGDDEAVVVEGWATSEQNFIKIFTPVTSSEVGASQRHPGKWDDTKYNISVEDYFGVISIGQSLLSIRIDGLQLKETGVLDEAGEAHCGIQDNHGTHDNGEYYISNNLIYSDHGHSSITPDGPLGIDLPYGKNKMYVWNNIVKGFNVGIYTGGTEDSNISIHNNTIINNNYDGINIAGWPTSAYLNIKNNLVQSNGTSFDLGNVGAGFITSYGNNISSDATAPGDDSLQDTNVIFWDEANQDYHLAPNSPGIDQGTSSVSSIVTDDIDGKPIRTWDIGADDASVEFVSTVMETGGDFSTLSSWEAAIQSDLTTTGTAVLDATSSTGIFQSFALSSRLMTGQTSGATGQLVHLSTTTSAVMDQFLLVNISGAFVAGEQVGDGQGTTTLINGGNPAIAVARIDGVWTNEDINQVWLIGWTTERYNYVKIYTTESARHSGKWEETKYRIYTDADSGLILYDIKYAIVDGLQIEIGGSDDYRSGIYSTGAGGKRIITNNIIKSTNSSNIGNQGIEISAWNEAADYNIYNNIIYGYNTAGMYISLDPGSEINIYNNTIYDIGSVGIHSELVYPNAINNIVNNANVDYDGSFSASSSNNISSDATAPGTDSQTNTTVTFVDAANNDYHLMPENDDADGGGKNPAIDAGYDLTLSTSTGSIRSSIIYGADGQERYDAKWDIGALEGPTILYRSVGRHPYDLNSSAATVTISSTTAIATFSADLPANVGVGDVIQFGGDGYYDVAFIHSRISSSTYDVRDRYGRVPTATTTASVGVFRAHEYIADWTLNQANRVNSLINDTVDDLVLIPNQDLTASNTAHLVACYASTSEDYLPDADIIFFGWTTATSSYIKIYTPYLLDEVGESQRHEGIWNPQKYAVRTNIIDVFDVEISDVRIDGLQINADQSQAMSGLSFGNAITYRIEISNNLINGNNTSGASNYGLIFSNVVAGNRAKVINNVIFGWGAGLDSHAIYQEGSGWNLEIYNNTIYGNNNGIAVDSSAYVVAQNNVIFNNYTNDYNNSADFDIFSFNASDDATGDNAINLGSSTAIWDATFVDWQNYDFRIRDIASVLYDAGTTITLVTDDIAGNPRPYDDAFDIGAFEYSGATPKYRFSPGGTFKMKGTIKFK